MSPTPLRSLCIPCKVVGQDWLRIALPFELDIPFADSGMQQHEAMKKQLHLQYSLPIDSKPENSIYLWGIKRAQGQANNELLDADWINNPSPEIVVPQDIRQMSQAVPFRRRITDEWLCLLAIFEPGTTDVKSSRISEVAATQKRAPRLEPELADIFIHKSDSQETCGGCGETGERSNETDGETSESGASGSPEDDEQPGHISDFELTFPLAHHPRVYVYGKRIYKIVKPSEMAIVKYLNNHRTKSENILYPAGFRHTAIGPAIIFPRELPISDLPYYHSRWARDFINGVAFLHRHQIAHMDLKPSNLVCTPKPENILKIIDFSVSVRSPSEEHTICGFRGTVGWTAPEVGKEDGPALCYSPRRADKWSCGAVIAKFALWGDDPFLQQFASLLMDKEPLHRPNLREWLDRNPKKWKTLHAGYGKHSHAKWAATSDGDSNTGLHK